MNQLSEIKSVFNKNSHELDGIPLKYVHSLFQICGNNNVQFNILFDILFLKNQPKPTVDLNLWAKKLNVNIRTIQQHVKILVDKGLLKSSYVGFPKKRKLYPVYELVQKEIERGLKEIESIFDY